MYLFTIYDQVSKKAGNVFLTATIGEAERQFNDALKTSAEGSLFRSHPQDFSLILLGEFDDVKVEISNVQKQTITQGKLPEVTADLR